MTAQAAVQTMARSETPQQTLARLLAENAALKQQMQAKAGEFMLDVTVQRAAGTKGANDKGSKGGTLNIALGNQHIYPSVAMIHACLDRADEIREFVTRNADKLTR